MDIKDFIRLLRKGWLLLATTTIIGIGIGAAYALVATKWYTATTELFVSVKSIQADSAGEVVQGSSAAQLKVKSYVEVIRSASVLGPVIEELHLHDSVHDLASRISTVAPQNTVLIEVSVVDEDPTRAAAIANAIGRSTSSAVQELEKTEDGSASPVAIETIQPATVPAGPSSPDLITSLMLATVGGLMAGFGVLLLRDKLDNRLHGRSEVESMTSTPVIGSIGYDSKAEMRPLVVHADPRNPHAESFRALRTNLQFLDPSNPDKTFVVTSSLPSEGKTTTSANLAIAIAESGSSVVLVDADLRRPRLAEVLGVEGAAGLSDVLVGRAELDDLLQRWGTRDLSVLPAGSIPPNPSELLGSSGMKALIDELARRFQYVVVDAPPLLPVTDAAVLSRFVRGTLLVASVKRVRKAQFREALASLHRIDRSPMGVILTMLPHKGPDGYGYGAYEGYYGKDADVQELRVSRGRRRGAGPDGPIAAEANG